MGIHGIYKEIGPGLRISIAKYASSHYETHKRPLRLAIDTSIWLFQIQASKGGTNPALRTFYYRLLRLLSLSIHPLFVFDGPNRPPMKRNKRTAPPGAKVANIPEFLAKQLLKQFGFPTWLAPGEAEAECALLQRMGVVDAVLSEDVDTLMFGSGVTLRNWTPERTSKVPTHVNVYEATKIKESSGLDCQGMVLIAMMSGGDYVPEGIPGCGPKSAVEAAKGGFGKELCSLKKNDTLKAKELKERLQHELKTNESKLFKRKHGTLNLPEHWPSMDVLGYYTRPVVSSAEKIENLRKTLKWDNPMDFPALRSFTADAFDWQNIGGAKKFIRNLAPALLVQQLRLRHESGQTMTDSVEDMEADEAKLVQQIHSRREHHTTDNTPELRISFSPMALVPIDLSIENPDDISPEPDSGDEDVVPEDPDAPASPKKRGPSTYDPTQLDKLWILETIIKIGVPLKVQDWEETQKRPAFLRNRTTAVETNALQRPVRATRKTGKDTNTSKATLRNFGTITKPGITTSEHSKEKDNKSYSQAPASSTAVSRQQPLRSTSPPNTQESRFRLPPVFLPSPTQELEKNLPPQRVEIDLLSSPISRLEHSDPSQVTETVSTNSGLNDDLPSTVTKRRRGAFTKAKSKTMPVPANNVTSHHERPTTPSKQSATQIESLDLSGPDICSPLDCLSSGVRAKRTKTTTSLEKEKSQTQRNDVYMENGLSTIDEDNIECLNLAGSPTPKAKPPRTITEWVRRSESLSPRKARQVHDAAAHSSITTEVEELDLTASSPVRPQMRMTRAQQRRSPAVHVEVLDLTASSPPKVAPSPSLASTFVRDVLHDIDSSPQLNQQCHQNTTVSTSCLVDLSIENIVYTSTSQAEQMEVSRKKRVYQLRESLEGAFAEIEVDESEVLDLTAPRFGKKDKRKEGQRRAWRASEVEFLDLTGD